MGLTTIPAVDKLEKRGLKEIVRPLMLYKARMTFLFFGGTKTF